MRKLAVVLTVLFAFSFLTVSSAQANCGKCCKDKQEQTQEAEKAEGEKHCPKSENKEGCPKQAEKADDEKTENQAQ